MKRRDKERPRSGSVGLRRGVGATGLVVLLLLVAASGTTGQTLRDDEPGGSEQLTAVGEPAPSASEAVGPSGERQTGPDGAEPAAESVASERPATRPDRRQLPRQPVFFAALALVGILLCGLLVIVLAVLWGRRVRRAAWEGVTRTRPTDEFWFLRPRKKGERGRAGDGPPATPSEDGPASSSDDVDDEGGETGS